jgi:hypothetical protein
MEAQDEVADLARDSFKMIRADLEREFANCRDDAEAQVWIDAMEGEVLNRVAKNLWVLERCKRAIAARDAAPTGTS